MQVSDVSLGHSNVTHSLLNKAKMRRSLHFVAIEDSSGKLHLTTASSEVTSRDITAIKADL